MGLRDMLHIKNKHSLSRTRSASPITEGVTAALARATLEIPRIDDNLSIRTVQPTLQHATTSGSSASQHSNSAAAQSTPATSTNSGHLPPGAAVPSVPGVPAYNTTPIPGSSSNVQPLLLDRQTLEDALAPLKPFYISLDRLKIEHGANDARGGYGVVRVGYLNIRSGHGLQKVAVKELTSDLHDVFPLRVAFRLAREMLVWCKLNHPNILSFTGYHLSEDLSTALLICPFIEEGNVKHYLAKHNPDYDERSRLVQDTLDGLEYLHSPEVNVCHGDLKSFNVLVTTTRRAILCDFGLATVREVAHTGLTTATDFKASFRWCPPEVADNKPRTFESDMWSWGCLALEIITGDFPYPAVTIDVAVVGQILKGKLPNEGSKVRMPPGCLGLLELCWSNDPLQRPTAQQATRAWGRCWNKVQWHPDFLLEDPYIASRFASVNTSSSPDPNDGLQPHANTWQGPISSLGHVQARNIPPPGHVPIQSENQWPLSSPPDNTQFADATVRRVLSLNRGAPELSPTVDDHSNVPGRGPMSDYGHGQSGGADGLRDVSKLMLTALREDTRERWLELCAVGMSPEGARNIASNVKSWLKHGSETVQLNALRVWVVVLRGSYQPFLSISSNKKFLKMIEDFFQNPRTPAQVKRRVLGVIGGAAWEFGKSYPDFRLSWAVIKGYGPAAEGIPFNDRDPYYCLPATGATHRSRHMSNTARSEPVTPPQRPLALPVQPRDTVWSTAAVRNGESNEIHDSPLSGSGHSAYFGSPPRGSAGRPSFDSFKPSHTGSSSQGSGDLRRIQTANAKTTSSKSEQSHRRGQSSGNVLQPKLCISVDFGTTLSGVAYTSSRINSGRVQSIVHWPGSQETHRKIPTCLMYDAYGRVIKWGLDAKEAKPMSGEMKCEWFKLYLEPRVLRDPNNLDPRLPPIPPGKRPKDVIVDYLTNLFEHARAQIKAETSLVDDINSAEIWLTVPAAWDGAGCNLMREAALDAGLVQKAHAGDTNWRDRLHIITEPEAAAVHCVALTDLNTLRPSENFIICDAGGGTVDLATYKVIGELRNLEIAEVCANSGANCGSIFLDLRFRELVRALLEEHPTHLDPTSLAYFMHLFATSEKLDFEGEEDDGKFFHFSCFNPGDPDDPAVGLVNGELAIPGVLLRREVFDPVVTEVLDLIAHQLQRSGAGVRAIMLVGGFSENPYLVKCVQKRFGGLVQVIAKPADADTATNRGAARYGVAGQALVSSVVAPRAYLMKAKLPAEPQDHQMRPAYISQNAAGAYVCDRRIQYLVHKGAILRKGQRVVTSFCKFSESSVDCVFVATLYTSDSDSVMRYTDEGPVQELCKWSVDLSMLPLFQEHSRKYKRGFYTDFELGLELDSAEVRGVLLQDGQEVSRVTFDFFQ